MPKDIKWSVLTNNINHGVDYGGAKCPKFNIVGSEELNNLEIYQLRL